MKTILELEFIFFCGVNWREVKIHIVASNRVQLIKSFIQETKSIVPRYRVCTPREIRKELWSEIKKDIETLELPFISSRVYL